MRVLYVSKASRVAAHREKLHVLGERVEVTLATPGRWGPAAWEEAPFDDELDIRRLPTLLHGHNHLHLYRGAGRLDPTAFDLVHIDEEPYSLATLQWAAWARRHRLPAVFFAWQNLPKRLPSPFRWARGRVFAWCRGGIAGTEEAARVLREAGFREPLLVSPQMGVSPDRFRPDPATRAARRRALAIPVDSPLVGYVGRLVPEKGVDLLVGSLTALPEAHLALVGEGPSAEPLRRMARELGVADRVHLAGAIPSLDVPGWTASFDVLALPSRTTAGWKEQFGRAMVEAMACGVPVVVSDSGALPEVAGPGGTVVPEGAQAALAAALRLHLGDPELARLQGQAGRAHVLVYYSGRRVVERQVAFYEEILAGSSEVAT